MIVRAIPPRISWAVETLAVEPDDRLLEIGGGGAVSLICERLRGGTITAIDRSSTMVERAVQRNQQHIASGKAAVRLGELHGLDLEEQAFSKVFAINVNLFWVRSPERELRRIARLLRSDGTLYLFDEAPEPAKANRIAEKLLATLPDLGFGDTRLTPSTDESLLCLAACPVGSAARTLHSRLGD